MRRLTRDAAGGPEGWTSQRADQVRALFDRIAPEWHTRARPERLIPVADALDRGGPFGDGLVVELGSGTGIATATIRSRLARLVAVDLSMEMLRRAPAIVPKVAADGATLPLRDDAVATLVLVNMLLFPVEAERVLEPGGALVWVSTAGVETPIYLAPNDVDDALPGEWDVVASEAGPGSWCVARRADPARRSGATGSPNTRSRRSRR